MVMLGLLLPEAAHRTAMLMFIGMAMVSTLKTQSTLTINPRFPDSTYLEFHLAPKEQHINEMPRACVEMALCLS